MNSVYVNESGYKFGFNGQVKDDEIYGEGNTYSAQFWEYDARLGRRWNIDPVTYPWQSSYSCFNSNPILYADPLGLYGEKRAKRMAERAKKQGYDVSEIKKYGSGKRDYGFTMTKEKSDGSGMYGAQKIGGSLKSIENDNYFTSYDEIKVYSFLNEGSEQKHQLNWWSRNSSIIIDYSEKIYDFAGNDLLGATADITDELKITKNVGNVLTPIEITNHAYHKFVKKDITTSEYLYKNTKTISLFVFGIYSPAIISAPATVGVYSYEKAYEYIDENVKKTETTFRSSSFWGKLYLGW